MSPLFSSSDIDISSVSAVSQRHDLLYPEIFKSINRRFLSSIDNLSTLNGYYTLAQDGSNINFPFLQDDTQISYGQDSIVCQYHLNALYDCINHVFWKSRIDLLTKKSEVNALIDFINHRNYPENSIITADRGYESYNLIAHCIENNQKFVFRVKDIDTKNGILTSLSLPDEKFDITVTRTLTNVQTNEVKKNENNQFVFYNINVRSTLTNIRSYFHNRVKESILIRNIKKYLNLSRPDRNVQRSIKRQSTKELNNRTS